MDKETTKPKTEKDFKRVLKERNSYLESYESTLAQARTLATEKNQLRQKILDLNTEIEQLKKDSGLVKLNQAYESAKMTIHAQRDELLAIYKTAFKLLQKELE